LCVINPPSGRRATMSVKVPPRSIQNCQRVVDSLIHVPGHVQLPAAAVHSAQPNQYAVPLISMLALGGTSVGHVGSSNAECATQCGSLVSESLVLNTSAS
jgi:hypothetical protein